MDMGIISYVKAEAKVHVICVRYPYHRHQERTARWERKRREMYVKILDDQEEKS